MSITTQFQIGVELTKIFPIRELAGTTYNKVMNFARDLRKTGSDLVVEEDLAAIFGRGKLEASLEKQFRKQVSKDLDITPTQYGSSITLDTRPGPTLNRALIEKDRYYLSAVVQLSLLAWFHKKLELALVLTECMRKRFSQRIPDARPDPGLEGILGTLRACASETSNFSWNVYVQKIHIKLQRGFEQIVKTGATVDHHSLNTIRPHTLLALMDFLYLIQAFPDERRVRLSDQTGLVPLVIWAHYILSLTVIIRGYPGGDVKFGSNPSPHVSIPWEKNYTWSGWLGGEVCLLDSAMSVVLRIDSDDIKLKSIAHAERIPVKEYGTTWLRRRFNNHILIADEDPLYQEVVELLVAMAITVSKRLVHGHLKPPGSAIGSMKEVYAPRKLEIDRFAIYEAATVLFADIPLDKKGIESFVSKMTHARTLADISKPTSLSTYLKRRASNAPNEPYREYFHGLDLLTLILLTFAMVPSIRSCSEMPISLWDYPLTCLSLSNRLIGTEGPIAVDEAEFFEVAALLLAPETVESARPQWSSHFLFSDFGWSLTLHNLGNADPATNGIGRYCFLKGVPTNTETGERKYCMQDLGPDVLNLVFANHPHRYVYERGDSYIPRSVATVSKRQEVYSTSRDAFLLMLDYRIKDTTRISNTELSADGLYKAQHFEMTSGFRALHRSLWQVHIGPSCDHKLDPESSLPLRMDMVTTSALDWADEGVEVEAVEVPERIAICLTKGDRHMRWLALQEATRSKKRQVMLRADGCEECTVEALADLPGQWIVIL